MITIVIMIMIMIMMETRKYFFDTINFNNKQWASKPSTSLKRKILKLEIREIRVIAPLFYDFFVLLFNLRFESQSDVIPTGSL